MTYTYHPLSDVISLDGISYTMNYLNEEKEILQPRLEELGYSEIEWARGETDSFGPLTRVCKAVNPIGEIEFFIYG